MTDNVVSLYRMENYNIFANCRNTHGGGVAIYANKKYSAHVIKHLRMVRKELESIFLHAVVGREKYVIGCIYRLPNFDVECFLSTLSEILHVVKTEYYSSTVFLHEDFNIDMYSSSAGGLCSEYLSLTYCNNLVSTILRPTRVGKSSATLIDNIFTDCCNLKLSGIILTNIRDHYAVLQGSNRLLLLK